jgi:hypothetical protein
MQDTFEFAARAQADALGEEVIWKPGTEEEVVVRGVFGSGFSRVESGGVRLSSKRTEVTFVTADLPGALEEGVQVSVRGQLYQVATPQPDVEDVSVTALLKKL